MTSQISEDAGARTHVVVLAAGRGSRLGSFGEERPKWLLDVGGRTIAERQLAAVERARRQTEGSVAEVRVVTGHAAPEIERFLASRAANGVATLHNPDYATINNWYSVLLALREIPAGDRVVIVNGDLFVQPGWITEFLAASSITSTDSLIGVDLARTLTDESMKVEIDSARPARVSRIGKVGIDDGAGEYVGLLMARGPVLSAFRDALESFVGNESSVDEWYERAVGMTAAEGIEWTVWPTPDSRWVEIDDNADLELAIAMAGGDR